jgi:hypothetical protein
VKTPVGSGIVRIHLLAACVTETLGSKCRHGFRFLWKIPSPDRLREQFSGLLRACFATVPNGIERKLQRTQKIGNLLHLADSFVCRSALRIFFFGFRFSVLNQIDAHDCWPPFALTAAFYLCLTCTGCKGGAGATEPKRLTIQRA